ncbi:hypothetical protein HanRHA438_Chr16g0757421 [Helianthus annuus]|nr:hypothetical protein HanHA300_Chr16g0608151 [Helianthus annuus]KAJ0442529.1 hypothetical protein HanIR_Chr16g0810351 [Helianthus annuus]KAJ0460266.1 hypothetical protein HanHA89_Chr16g0658711 [Helianthus annuus]KAJ0640704.1 hypothetical protein HanLR1_Chr16g0618671 [Helianthus annuus]KAJ0644627.1 hypothetical protein HanOQP8_Chr16g0614401 [Helianthus annuus]
MPSKTFTLYPDPSSAVHFLSCLHTDCDLTDDVVFTRIHLSPSFSLISLTTHISPVSLSLAIPDPDLDLGFLCYLSRDPSYSDPPFHLLSLSLSLARSKRFRSKRFRSRCCVCDSGFKHV